MVLYLEKKKKKAGERREVGVVMAGVHKSKNSVLQILYFFFFNFPFSVLDEESSHMLVILVRIPESHITPNNG